MEYCGDTWLYMLGSEAKFDWFHEGTCEGEA